MQRALESGSRPFYAADLWLSVNNGMIDTQEDFKASVAQNRIDFDAKPGFARLAMQTGAYDIEQTFHNAGMQCYGSPKAATRRFSVQKVPIFPGRTLTSVVLDVDNTAGSYTLMQLYIFNQDHYGQISGDDPVYVWALPGLVAVYTCSVAAGYNGEITFPINPTAYPLSLDLPEGDYFFWVAPMVPGHEVLIRYQNSDVFAGGEMYTVDETYYGTLWNWSTAPAGDMYFKLELSGYYAWGSFTSKVMDLGEVPVYPGAFQMAYDLPSGTDLAVNLIGSNNADLSSGTTYSKIMDGQEIAPYRYWQTINDFKPNGDLDQTPIIDMQEVLFPKDRIQLREKVKLFNVADDIQKNFQALLSPLDFTTAEINLIDRVSTGGSASATIEDRTGAVIQKIISDSPLKNHRVMLYMGADVPDFAEQDLLRFFIGSVQAATYKPGYQGGLYQLPLTFKNPVLELKRKVPQPGQTGLLDQEVLALDYNGAHVMDVIIDIIRGKAGVPGRYVDIESFYGSKPIIGDEDLPSASFVVRRSNVLANYTPRVLSQTTGNGTLTNAMQQEDSLLGDYVIACKTVVAGGGVFSVKNPDKTALADATVGVPYTSAEINFLINAGTIDFKKKDRFTLSLISPDTRIKSATEVVDLLKALATIADGYITADESSRISFVKHDPDAAAEATWADYDLVQAGTDAVPIFALDSCDLGYDKYLFNTAVCGCEWDGAGDKWENLGRVFGEADGTSIADFGQGQDDYVSIMEKNLREPSKWLGPEDGYNGETLAKWIAKKLVTRFAYPPVVITGAVLPLGQFMRTQGSVVTIWSKRFAAFRRNGIALSETKKFMILSKKLNSDRSRCVFNLVELT